MKRSELSTPEIEVRAILDTAFCLDLIHTHHGELLEIFAEFAPGEIAISALTVAILQARAQMSREPARNLAALAQFLLPLVVADFDAEAARQLGAIAATPGLPIGEQAMHMLTLAAQALDLNALLVTTRPAAYSALPQLRIRAVTSPAITAVERQAPRRLQSAPGAILAIGSHDLTLDLLGDYLHTVHPELTLVSAHVGSMAGLLALQRGEAHLAGTHLLDEETGEYNVEHIRRVLTSQGSHVILVGFVTRVQGLMVQRGNPKQITSLDDLVRSDVAFVNRQPGAGTRVLLDHELRRRGVDTQQIRGYARCDASHLAVAVTVASGAADCGLGIQAAAHAHDLDFVPLLREQYDLAIPIDHYESALLAPLLALLRQPTPEFLGRVATLGGYDASRMGKVLAEL